MKKNIVKFFIAFALPLFFACNNDNDLLKNDSQNENNDIQVVNGVLKFQSQAVYDSIATKLSEMSLQERDLFYKGLGFEPISSLLSKADEELEQVVNVRTVEEFNSNYAEFKNKYGDIFLFNDQDKEDLSPYSKFVSLNHELVTSDKGYFYIGDAKIVPESYQTFSEKMEDSEYVSLRASSHHFWDDTPNHAWAHTSSRKVGLYLSMDRTVTNTRTGHPINVTFTSQKKNVFGWVRYSTIYYANFYFDADVTFMNGYNYGYYTSGKEKSGSYSFTLAYAKNNIGGIMECWSRGVEEKLKGSATINLKYK